MKWEYDEVGKYWTARRPYCGSNIYDFIYVILGDDEKGYTAEAYNNAYGEDRVAVENEMCEEGSIFDSLEALKERIENGTQLWLYTECCDCIGEITTKEY